MKIPIHIFCMMAMLSSTPVYSQKVFKLVKKLDSLSIKTYREGRQINPTQRSTYNRENRIGFGVYFILLGSDFKQQITSPFHMRGKDWGRLGILAAGTGALLLVDKPIQKFTLDLRNHNKILRQVSTQVTKFGQQSEAYTLAGLFTYGLIFKNNKMKTTALLATQSVFTSAALAGIIKTISGRQRPSRSDSNHIEAEPTFHGPFYKGGKDENGKKINTSFPSGHATAAFSAATVYAMEYNSRPWVGVISYTAATLIAVSRITENKHWFTDIVLGAAVGYFTGRQVTNNYHRYVTLKNAGQKKNEVTFSLQYNYGVVMPAMVYKFR